MAMESSDDELEASPPSVSNYHFVDEKDEPVSFSVLPFQWDDNGSPGGERKQVFLHGSADNGLQKIYKQVTAWKFYLSEAMPEISVRSKDNNWIKLQKPRKSFEDVIRSILVTMHTLHFVKKNPEAYDNSVWDHLEKVFSFYDLKPSQNDLVDHLSLISEAVKRDEILGKSQFLLKFLEEKPQKLEEFDEAVQNAAKPGFIVDDEDLFDNDDVFDDGNVDEDGAEGQADVFDSVCAICDNGGELLCCDGDCMRSFHATVEAGAESMCKSLGLTDAQVEAMQSFHCKNCQYKMHQCFSCGKLGSSDKSSGAKVFRCCNATCGRFYHPHCVAKLVHREDETAAEELQNSIAAGVNFVCPIHKCHVCNSVEDKGKPELQLAVCRRCPKSYHRKCLPRKIAFEDREDEGVIQRAWEGLLQNRILIYCLKHDIDEDIGTPRRDHVKFPVVQEKGKKHALGLLSSKEKVRLKKRNLDSEDSLQENSIRKVWGQVEKSSSALKVGDYSKKSEKRFSEHDSVKKLKVNHASTKSLHDNIKKFSKKAVKSSTAIENRTLLGDKLYELFQGSGSIKPRRQDVLNSETEKTLNVKPIGKKLSSSLVPLDAGSEKRILELMQEITSSVTLDEITKSRKVLLSTYSAKSNIDKIITQGKVEGSVEALRTALQKLEQGCGIDDAKAVCEPEVLHQIVRWKNKLKVYLAPFLHGMRYTSFGRHFTKVDKLKEIVDKLHSYVQNGDTIVDFCCGANDFSCLMKNKLEEVEKKCSFKNYDLHQAKHDFNFERRDWMTVQPKELPPGSQLIMGLNPPFGVKASLANQFIDKALEFKPKLLILIVPPETKRLDQKRTPYDLIWEDSQKFSGKSFYLPGSVDIHDKQMEQWNVTPPVLYLWSRPDWTAKHMVIAQKHGHLPKVENESHLEENRDGYLEENHDERQIPDCTVGDNCAHHSDMPLSIDFPVQNDELEVEGSRTIVTGGQEESGPCITGVEDGENHDCKERESNKNSRKRKLHGGKHSRVGETSPKDTHSGRRPPSNEMYTGKPHGSLSGDIDSRSSLERFPSQSREMPSHIEPGEQGFRNSQPSISESGLPFGMGHDGAHVGILDDEAPWFSNGEQPYISGTRRWPIGSSPDSIYYKPYTSGNPRELEIRQQVQLYGQQGPESLTHRGSYTMGHDPGYNQVGTPPSTYGQLGMAAESSFSRMNASAMQRYAPRLDELNHTRMSPLGPEPPMLSRNGGVFDPLVPQPRQQFDSTGFAPGPHRPFSYNSSGWLND